MSEQSLPVGTLEWSDLLEVGTVEQLREALSAALPGQERRWLQRVRHALHGVASALHGQLAETAATDGVPAAVDPTRPSLQRQARHLCQEQRGVLAEVLHLEEELRVAEEAPPVLRQRHGQSTQLIPGFVVLQEWADQVLAQLNAIRKSEHRLVLDSVNTDLGTGD